MTLKESVMIAVGIAAIVVFAVSLILMQSNDSVLKTVFAGIALLIGGIIAVEIFLLLMAAVVPLAGAALLAVIVICWMKRIIR